MGLCLPCEPEQSSVTWDTSCLGLIVVNARPPWGLHQCAGFMGMGLASLGCPGWCWQLGELMCLFPDGNAVLCGAGPEQEWVCQDPALAVHVLGPAGGFLEWCLMVGGCSSASSSLWVL